MSFSRYPQIQDYVCLKFPTDQVQQHAHDLIHASLSSFIQEMEINGHSTWNPPTILLGECNSFLTYHRLPSFLCFSKKKLFCLLPNGGNRDYFKICLAECKSTWQSDWYILSTQCCLLYFIYNSILKLYFIL